MSTVYTQGYRIENEWTLSGITVSCCSQKVVTPRVYIVDKLVLHKVVESSDAKATSREWRPEGAPTTDEELMYCCTVAVYLKHFREYRIFGYSLGCREDHMK